MPEQKPLSNLPPSQPEQFTLPAPCAPGRHRPVIMHRTRLGGNDAMVRNTCGVCGQQIERDSETGTWVTEQQADEYNAELQAEAREEYEREMYEAMHPEERCPPRE